MSQVTDRQLLALILSNQASILGALAHIMPNRTVDDRALRKHLLEMNEVIAEVHDQIGKDVTAETPQIPPTAFSPLTVGPILGPYRPTDWATWISRNG